MAQFLFNVPDEEYLLMTGAEAQTESFDLGNKEEWEELTIARLDDTQLSSAQEKFLQEAQALWQKINAETSTRTSVFSEVINSIKEFGRSATSTISSFFKTVGGKKLLYILGAFTVGAAVTFGIFFSGIHCRDNCRVYIPVTFNVNINNYYK
ncbi:MAG TPA: hypothetical protein VLF20_01110 [Patescibacteria group bacterium]|nr:hypothetical protein [Patescibacteria group bacterium]